MSITVNFTDQSLPGPSGPITAWAWDFGDGGTSTSQNPSHAYAAAGSYTVALTVTGTGGDGTSSTSQSVAVASSPPLAAAFSSSATGLAASFTDLSTPGPSGPITGWAWNFGDGATSTSQNPSHTYAAGGSYSVTLTVTGTAPDGTASTSHTRIVSSGGGATPVPVGNLLFSDEFNGGSIDTSKWEAQNRTSDGGGVWDGFTHVALDGSGNLVITAVKISGVWHSGLIISHPAGGYSGPRYIESRAIVAGGVGTWSGPLWEWSYPYGKATDGGPNVENDVCEQLGREPNSYNATFHVWNHTTNPRNGQLISTGTPLASGYHIYGAVVTTGYIDYYLDGVNVGTRVLASSVGLSDLATPKMTANIGLDMGGWGGTPTIAGPVHLIVDYVRVYRLA